MVRDNFSGKYPATAVLAVAALSGVWYSFVANQVVDPYLVRALSLSIRGGGEANSGLSEPI
jgi:hypothetical protein